MESQSKRHWQAESFQDDILQTYAANQLDRAQNQLIRVERDRHTQRTGSHCKQMEIAILCAHDHSTEPLHVFLKVSLDGARGRGRSRR